VHGNISRRNNWNTLNVNDLAIYIANEYIFAIRFSVYFDAKLMIRLK